MILKWVKTVFIGFLFIAMAGCSSPSPNSNMGYFSSIHKGNLGMDISHWSYPVNFTTARSAGIQFVYMKCGGGSLDGSSYSQDSQFTSANVKAARDAGLKVGFYWYKNPDVGGKNAAADAVVEADLFYSYISGVTSGADMGDILPVLDYENPNGPIISLTGNQAYLWLKSFVDEYKAKSGTPIMLYTAYYTIAGLGGQFYTSIATEMPLWLSAVNQASYNFTKFGGYADWTVWQYLTDITDCGASGSVDLDDADLTAILIPN